MPEGNSTDAIAQCPTCACKLKYRPKSVAGKITCPKCGEIFRVPPATIASSSPPPFRQPESWYVKSVDNREFGPFSMDQILGFVQEGRVCVDTWLRIGESPNSKWIQADEIPSINQHLIAERTTGQATEDSPRQQKIAKTSGIRVSTIIAFCMLGCTLLLPISMIGLWIYTAATIKNQDDSGAEIEIMPGHTISQGDDGLYTYESPRIKEAKEAGQALGIFLGGLCCPLIPYVLIMLVLGTSFIAFRSAGS
jgi:hypothetical protein